MIMQTPQPTLRPVQDSDSDFLMSLFKTTTEAQMFSQMADQLSQQILQSQFTIREQSFCQLYPEGENSIIGINNKPVGRFLINIASDEIRLVDINIIPSMRKKGIGSYLINQLLAHSMDLKIPVRLQVLVDNILAQHLYEKLGFVARYNDGINVNYEFK